jgi:hypothetical protein
MLSNPPLVLDSDIISTFAHINRLDILEYLYSERLLVLDEVFWEVSRSPKVGGVLSNTMNRGCFRQDKLNLLGEDGMEYARLVDRGNLGKGEAAVLAYTRYRGGTVGSSNIRDVLLYCENHDLPLLATRPIVYDAYCHKIITLAEACKIWTAMQDRTRLPNKSFEEVVYHFTGREGGILGKQRY